MADWRWASARAWGTSHEKIWLPCQDAVAARSIQRAEGAVLVAVASDGAGSARYSRQGARIVARGFVAAAEQWFAGTADAPGGEDLARWVDTLRSQINAVAAAREAQPRDFAATLVACIVTAHQTVIAHVGDGACVVSADESDEVDRWTVASWPRKGEYANQTDFVTAPGCTPRVTVINRPVREVAVFSDGIEELVLDEVGEQPHAGFFAGVFRPMREGSAAGRDRGMSRALRDLLTGALINGRTDDDKSLVLAVRR